MKIVFMGTPVFSVPILEALIREYEVVCVVTQPDKKVGRKQELRFSPIKEVAVKHDIKVCQPVKIRTEYDFLNEIDFDIIITAAYGQIIPKEVLDMPKLGCINVHGSLLPKLRGGAPIHKSILYGHKETGITIMYMAEKMDAGNMISKKVLPILDEDTVGTLHDKMSLAGMELLMDTLPAIIDGTNDSVEQDHDEATFAYNIKREEELVDFNKSKREVFNHIRAFNPWPVAYAMLGDKSLKLYKSKILDETYDGVCGEIVELKQDSFVVKVSDGAIEISEIKYEGKKQMFVKDFLNGQGKNLIKVGVILNNVA